MTATTFAFIESIILFQEPFIKTSTKLTMSTFFPKVHYAQHRDANSLS